MHIYPIYFQGGWMDIFKYRGQKKKDLKHNNVARWQLHTNERQMNECDSCASSVQQVAVSPVESTLSRWMGVAQA